MITIRGFENFDKAPKEKQQAVLTAGFRCFAEDGYRKTAMSEIAAAANVSKPSLFHYFGSKREMYLYLFSFACDKIAGQIPEGTDDFFECISIGSKIKLAVMQQHPGMYEFLFSLVKSGDSETIEMLKQENAQAIADGTKKLFAHVDWSRFKPEVDKNDAVEMVSALSNGYLRDYIDKPRDELVEKMDKHLRLLKQALYKEEYL
ncbi:MAG: TetR/AcrR family transcriptional regulator [Coriobacteriales bacterium]|nr:TetR/AcrR family transcriptional regulator [Coriobacteriales bacterium]